MRIAGLAVLVALLSALVVGSRGGVADAANASEAAHEAQFVALINDLRRDRGLNALTVDGELTGLARSWSATMASNGQLSHATDLSVGVSSSWDLLGENVGVHDIHDVEGLFAAFVASPAHLANLTEPSYDALGVGVFHGADGRLWTTHRFLSSATAPAPAPAPLPPPTPPPTTATPPPTTTTTTATATAPPTTTTAAPPTTVASPTTVATTTTTTTTSPPPAPPRDLDLDLLARLFDDLAAAGL